MTRRGHQRKARLRDTFEGILTELEQGLMHGVRYRKRASHRAVAVEIRDRARNQQRNDTARRKARCQLDEQRMQRRIAAKCTKGAAIVLAQRHWQRLRRAPSEGHPRWIAEHQVEAVSVAGQLSKIDPATPQRLARRRRAQRVAFAQSRKAQRRRIRREPKRRLGDRHRQRADVDPEQLMLHDLGHGPTRTSRRLARRLHQESAGTQRRIQNAQPPRLQDIVPECDCQRIERSADNDAGQGLGRVIAARAFAQVAFFVRGASRQERFVQLPEGFDRQLAPGLFRRR